MIPAALFAFFLPVASAACATGPQAAEPMDPRALLEEVRRRPDRFDPQRLDSLGEALDPALLPELGSLLPLVTERSRRDRLLRTFAGFAGTPAQADATRLLREQAVDRDDAPAACRTLRQFLPEGRLALREIVLADSDEVVRYQALFALTEGRRQAEEALCRAVLQSALQPPALRRLALQLLARNPALHDELVAYLEDPEPELQAAALEILSRSRHAAAFDRARMVLDQEHDPTLRIRALEALRREGGLEAARALLRAARRTLGEERTFALRALSVLPGTLLPPLLTPLLRPDSPLSGAFLCLDLAALVPEEHGLSYLEQLLEHDDPAVRAETLRQLGGLDAAVLLPPIRRELHHASPLVRAAALVAVTRLGESDAAWDQRLRLAARHSVPLLRLAAAESYSVREDPADLGMLHELATDDDWRVREMAIEGLGTRRDAASVPLLVARLADERARLRERLGATLRHITGQSFGASPRDWARWWNDAQSTFEVPPLAEVEARERRRAEGASQIRTFARFYGLPVTSDRLTLVLDISGSMQQPATGGTGTRLEAAQRQVEELVEALPASARLNLVFFNADVFAWRRSLVPLGRGGAAQAVAFSRSRLPVGATNLFGALERALRDPEVDTIYVLSDGEPTVGRLTLPTEIVAEVRRLNPGGRVTFHTVTIGRDSPLLRQLAADTGGLSAQR